MDLVIPLQGGSVNAHQVQTVRLGENTLQLVINWVTRFGYWSMDISREGVPLINGIVLARGVNMVKIYDAEIGRFYMTGEDPTLDNLGTGSRLVWSDD